MRNPLVIKLDAEKPAWHIEKPRADPERINDRERRGTRPEIVALESSPIAVPWQRSGQHPLNAEGDRAPRAGHAATVSPVSQKLPTVEEFRQKAQECRADAARYTIPELRANLLAIASEYERLATRGEQFEARSQLPKSSPMNAIAISQWFASAKSDRPLSN